MDLNKKNKNTRGDIPVTILTMGVFVVCILAIFSFIHSSLVINKSFTGIDLMEKANIYIEKDSLDNYYDEKNITIMIPNLSLHWFEEKTIFSVMYERNP